MLEMGYSVQTHNSTIEESQMPTLIKFLMDKIDNNNEKLVQN